jgi:lipid II:glycine glycyltransferase (peptidoglycan interpeptide bridge formation enzyme)
MKMNGGHVLQCEIIRDACSRKYSVYDFNQSGGHDNVVVFKSGFGTQKREINIYKTDTWLNKLYRLTIEKYRGI